MYTREELVNMTTNIKKNAWAGSVTCTQHVAPESSEYPMRFGVVGIGGSEQDSPLHIWRGWSVYLTDPYNKLFTGLINDALFHSYLERIYKLCLGKFNREKVLSNFDEYEICGLKGTIENKYMGGYYPSPIYLVPILPIHNDGSAGEVGMLSRGKDKRGYPIAGITYTIFAKLNECIDVKSMPNQIFTLFDGVFSIRKSAEVNPGKDTHIVGFDSNISFNASGDPVVIDPNKFNKDWLDEIHENIPFKTAEVVNTREYSEFEIEFPEVVKYWAGHGIFYNEEAKEKYSSISTPRGISATVGRQQVGGTNDSVQHNINRGTVRPAQDENVLSKSNYTNSPGNFNNPNNNSIPQQSIPQPERRVLGRRGGHLGGVNNTGSNVNNAGSNVDNSGISNSGGNQDGLPF